MTRIVYIIDAKRLLINSLLQLRLFWQDRAVFDQPRRISSRLQINQLGFPRLIEFFSKIFNCSVKANKQRHLKKKNTVSHKVIETPVIVILELVVSVMECYFSE